MEFKHHKRGAILFVARMNIRFRMTEGPSAQFLVFEDVEKIISTVLGLQSYNIQIKFIFVLHKKGLTVDYIQKNNSNTYYTGSQVSNFSVAFHTYVKVIFKNLKKGSLVYIQIQPGLYIITLVELPNSHIYLKEGKYDDETC